MSYGIERYQMLIRQRGVLRGTGNECIVRPRNDIVLGTIPLSPVAVVSLTNAHNLLAYSFQFHIAIHHSS